MTEWPAGWDAALRGFLQTLLRLREHLDEADFAAICRWIGFCAGEPPIAH